MTSSRVTPGALSGAWKARPVDTRWSFWSLIRWIDSITATASCWPSRPTSWPVSTRPVTSLGRSILVGRTSGFIIMTGASELPPESEFREPISVSSEPKEPARAMPYIGLCGLLPVSFSERAGMMQPLVAAAVPGDTRSRMPRRKALSLWKDRPSELSTWSWPVVGSMTGGIMSPGRPWRL
jgi:hypothetical protein